MSLLLYSVQELGHSHTQLLQGCLFLPRRPPPKSSMAPVLSCIPRPTNLLSLFQPLSAEAPLFRPALSQASCPRHQPSFLLSHVHTLQACHTSSALLTFNFFQWNLLSLSHLRGTPKPLLTSSLPLFSKAKPVTKPKKDSFFLGCFLHLFPTPSAELDHCNNI